VNYPFSYELLICYCLSKWCCNTSVLYPEIL